MPNANRSITAAEVRLVDQNGEMIGVVSFSDALTRAKSVSLDLVEVSPQAKPPVCKILDFGKYKYDIKKKAQEAKKKQKVTALKEVKFRPNIGENDFMVKLRKIEKFIADDDRVKVSLWFRGREIVHNELGIKLFQRILEEMGDSIKVDVEPKTEGKQMMMMLAPNKV